MVSGVEREPGVMQTSRTPLRARPSTSARAASVFSRAMMPAVTDGLRGASAECLQKGPELQLRLGQLPFGLGLRDDAATRVERRAARVDQRRAKSHREL